MNTIPSRRIQLKTAQDLDIWRLCIMEERYHGPILDMFRTYMHYCHDNGLAVHPDIFTFDHFEGTGKITFPPMTRPLPRMDIMPITNEYSSVLMEIHSWIGLGCQGDTSYAEFYRILLIIMTVTYEPNIYSNAVMLKEYLDDGMWRYDYSMIDVLKFEISRYWNLPVWKDE